VIDVARTRATDETTGDRTADHDPDRLARVQRKATVLASLNHPNIAHINGFEDSNGVRALVTELTDGKAWNG
jgi:serine/threonine protein kinase